MRLGRLLQRNLKTQATDWRIILDSDQSLQDIVVRHDSKMANHAFNSDPASMLGSECCAAGGGRPSERPGYKEREASL